MTRVVADRDMLQRMVRTAAQEAFRLGFTAARDAPRTQNFARDKAVEYADDLVMGVVRADAGTP